MLGHLFGISRHHYHDPLGSRDFDPARRLMEFEWMQQHGFKAMRTWLMVQGDMLELNSDGMPAGITSVAMRNLEWLTDVARRRPVPIQLLLTCFNFANGSENARFWQEKNWLSDYQARRGLARAAAQVAEILSRQENQPVTGRFGIDLANEPEGFWSWGRPAGLSRRKARRRLLEFLSEVFNLVQAACAGKIPITVGQHSADTFFPFPIDYRQFHWYESDHGPKEAMEFPRGATIGEWASVNTGSNASDADALPFQNPDDAYRMALLAQDRGYQVFFWFNRRYDAIEPLTPDVANVVRAIAEE